MIRFATTRLSPHQLISSLLFALAWPLMLGCGQPAPEPLDLMESFDGDTYDRSKWQLATPNEKVGTVEVKDGALLITAPPLDQPRPQIGNGGKFSLSGDFEVAFDFQLLTPIPDPTQDYINLELILAGSNGMAHFSRANHLGSGDGLVVYFAPSSDTVEVTWKHVPLSDLNGTLRLKRTADKLQFLFLGKGAAEPEEVASVAFGVGPVQSVTIALSVSSPTKQELKVRIDNVQVKTMEEPRSFFAPVALLSLLLMTLFAGAVAAWLGLSGKFRGGRTSLPNEAA